MNSSGEKLWRQSSTVVGGSLGNSESYAKDVDLRTGPAVSNGVEYGQRGVVTHESPIEMSRSRRYRKGCMAISACILLVIVAVIAVVVGVKVGHKNDNDGSSGAAPVSANSISSICNGTL
jgi:hypothetical protein